MSVKTHDAVKLTTIQVRLIQGIKGMTCPRPYDEGQVSRNGPEMVSLFVDRHQEGGTDELVYLFDKLLNW